MTDERKSAALAAASRRQQNEKRLAELRLDRAAAERRQDWGAVEAASHEIGVREDWGRQLERDERIAAAASLTPSEIGGRTRDLRAADAGLTPLERAEFRGRHQAEDEAIGRRVGELNAPPTQPAADPLADDKAKTRALYKYLQDTNPVRAAQYQEGREWLLHDEPEREPEPPGAA